MAAIGTGAITVKEVRDHLEANGESNINSLGAAIDVFDEASANVTYYTAPPDRLSDFRGYDSQRPVEWVGLDYYCELGTPPTDNPPISPTVTFVSKTHDEVNISWAGATDDNGVEAYGIYIDSVLVDTVDAAVSTYQHTGLDPSTLYRFHVTAIDIVPQSSELDEYVDVTTNAAPTGNVTAPTSGSVIDEGEGSLQITYSGATASAGVKGYNIYHRGVFIQYTTLTTVWVIGLREGTFADLEVETVDNNDVVSPTKFNITDGAYPLFHPINDLPDGEIEGASRCIFAPDFVLHAKGTALADWYIGGIYLGTSNSITITMPTRETTYYGYVDTNGDGILEPYSRTISVENCNNL